MKNILLIAHAPSENTRTMAQAVVRGCQHPDISGIQCQWLSPFDTDAEAVKQCHGIILGTTENLGYMSGALKDFFSLYTFNIDFLLLIIMIPIPYEKTHQQEKMYVHTSAKAQGFHLS